MECKQLAVARHGATCWAYSAGQAFLLVATRVTSRTTHGGKGGDGVFSVLLANRAVGSTMSTFWRIRSWPLQWLWLGRWPTHDRQGHELLPGAREHLVYAHGQMASRWLLWGCLGIGCRSCFSIMEWISRSTGTEPDLVSVALDMAPITPGETFGVAPRGCTISRTRLLGMQRTLIILMCSTLCSCQYSTCSAIGCIANAWAWTSISLVKQFGCSHARFFRGLHSTTLRQCGIASLLVSAHCTRHTLRCMDA